MRKGILYSLGLSRKTFSADFISIFAILGLVILTITPKIYIGTYVMALWIVFFFLQLNRLYNSNSTLIKTFFLGVIFVTICVFYKLLGISSASMAYCMSAPFSYFATILALVVIEKCNNKQQIRFLFHFVCMAIAINIADNIRLYYVVGIEDIAFQNIAGVLEDEGITNLNLGGSLFVTMTMFYSGVMFLLFLKSERIKEKILFMTYFSISAFFILFCSLKASVVLLLSIFIVLMYVAFYSGERAGRLLLFTVFIGGMLMLYRNNIIYFLINLIDSERISNRLIVFTSESGVSESSTFMNRERLWQVSLQSWLKNFGSFIFGIGDHDWSKSSSTAASGVGNHSDLLDVLARYGLMGGLVLYSSIKMYYDYLQKKYGTFFKWEIIAFFITLFLTGLTKLIVSSQTAIIIFILFPLSLKYLSLEKSY